MRIRAARNLLVPGVVSESYPDVSTMTSWSTGSVQFNQVIDYFKSKRRHFHRKLPLSLTKPNSVSNLTSPVEIVGLPVFVAYHLVQYQRILFNQCHVYTDVPTYASIGNY